MNFRSIILIAACLLALSGCETNAVTGKRQLTPNASAALSRLGQDTLTIGENALAGAASASMANAAAQAVGGGQFDSAALQAAAVSGALSGANVGIRSLESARTAPSAAIIQQAMVSNAGPALPPSVASGVSGAVVAAVAQGVPIDTALEKAAVSLDTAAAKPPKS